MELFNVLGLNLKILIAQFINFAIFFFVLYKFAYKPILKFLDDRKDKIEKGIENAQRAEEKLINIEKQEKETIEKATNEAKKTAKEIIEHATKTAEDKRVSMIIKTKEEIKDIVKKEKEGIELAKSNAIKEIKKETAELITISLKKILEENIDVKKDMEIIKKSIAKK